MGEGNAQTTANRNRRVTSRLLFAMLGALLPVLLIGALAYRIATGSARDAVRAGNTSAATLAGEIVRAEFRGRLLAISALGSVPAFVDAVARRDEQLVREFLRAGVEADPLIVRSFAADTGGVLWSDWPIAPESLGKNFSMRDWFGCVMGTGKACVSEIFRRNAIPRVNVVVISVPIEDGKGELIAIVAQQIRLEGLTALFQDVEIGHGGMLILLDPNGHVATHPTLDLQGELQAPYGDFLAQDGGNRGDSSRAADLTDPITGRAVIASVVPLDIAGRKWSMIAEQPVGLAFSGVRRMGRHIALAATLVSIIGIAVFWIMLRAYRQLNFLNTQLAQEIAERERAEESLQRLNANLEQAIAERTEELRMSQEQFFHAQKMEAVGRLAGGVAHDFNNLLTVILSYSMMMLGRMSENDPQRVPADRIHQAGERAKSLTRQLLAFSRKQVMQPRVLDLNESVGRSLQFLRRLIGEDIEIVTNLNKDLGRIEADPGQIEQIVMNLAVNARDAMPRGGKLIIETRNVVLDEAYARTRPEARIGPHVMLAITDTGHGMDSATREKLFEPFFTTKERGKGTGLGLATVYGIVKQSGGNIWVYSEIDHGTTFKIYFPRIGDMAESAAAASAKTAPQRGSERILVVEDEADVRELLCEVLSESGYTVFSAASPDQASRVFDEQDGKIDLLLTDVVMPGIGGARLARALQERNPAIRVLYMSGYTDDSIVHHGVLDRGIAFLEKPMLPDELLKKVREVLEQG